ncbi:hypothetical protein NP233_g8827 [Leucocoprinus birnbaumii]|uniref:Uncharacterized protein n=1 Tax=Leucocoprinus birnbaumii TaxID=56174 RepID=A0AAD5VNB0_9AGAR|nr:hypothetical protein NP233_g8827 [Leucocoprinus birnbaumii]
MAPAQINSNAVEAWSRSTTVRGSITSILAETTLEVQASEFNATGSGTAFGPHASGGTFQGTLAFDDWRTVRYSGPLEFSLVEGGIVPGGILVTFSLRGRDVATLTAVGVIVGGSVGTVGTFTWKYVSVNILSHPSNTDVT